MNTTTPTVNYNGRVLDVERLKKVSLQGIRITVHASALHTPYPPITHNVVVVAARGKDKYDVLLGDWDEKTKNVVLISTPVIKKAEVVTGGPEGDHEYTSETARGHGWDQDYPRRRPAPAENIERLRDRFSRGGQRAYR